MFLSSPLLGWNHFVSHKVKHWEYFYTDWIQSADTNILVIHFENLVDNLEWNLLRVSDFLDLETDPKRLACVLRNAEGQFHRRPKNSAAANATLSQIIKDPFSEDQKHMIREAISRVDLALKSASLEAIPIHKYDFFAKDDVI